MTLRVFTPIRQMQVQSHRLMSMSSIRWANSGGADDVIRRKMLEKIIRVDHAGELGASYIYKGQMTILKNHQRAAPLIQEMWDQEKAHLKKFEELLITYNISAIMESCWIHIRCGMCTIGGIRSYGMYSG